MDAIISAKAGIVAIVRGNEASVINIDDLETEVSYPISSMRFFFSGAKDVRKIHNISKSNCVKLLKKEYNNNRALTLTLLLLNEQEDDETLSLAVECLQDFLGDDEAFTHVENTLFSNIMPYNADMCRAKEYAKSIEKLYLLFNSIEQHSPRIELLRKLWDSLPDEIFYSTMDKILYEEHLVSTGAFKDLVIAGTDHKKFNLAHIKCLQILNSFRNSRIVVEQWLSELMPYKGIGFNIEKLIAKENKHKKTEKTSFKSKLKPHDAFENAKKQKSAIISLLKTSDWNKTRRYVDDLIESQRISSKPEHISMSLCDLSQHAKLVKNYSLQLELAKKAVEISDKDGWAYCQVAESYFCLNQFDKAIEYFKLADTYGEHEYAQNGLARILREQGKLDDAISIYKKLIKEFPNSVVVLNCYAETLRDVWKIDEALAVYDASIDNLSYDSTSYCGKASLLKSIGRLDEALSLYKYARDTSNDSHYIGCGIAEIFRLKGEFERSLAEYDKVINRFPDEIVPRCAKANVLKVKGDLNAALKEYQSTSKEFPYDSSSKEGIAEVYREMKDYNKAMALYNEILDKNPMSIRSRNGRANLFKCLGKYKDALRAYDENVRDFPYDLVAWSGRADILKQLGELDEAIKAFKRISEINSYDKRPLYSTAAIHVVKGEFDLALKLLPTARPQSKDDWFAYYVRGMIYMKSGNLEEGVKYYTDALDKAPSYTILNLFKNALTIAKLRDKNNKEVPDFFAIDNVDNNQNEYVKNVISIHAYGKTDQIKKAKESYIKVETDCPPYLITLRDELAAMYLKKISSSYDLEWIYDQECNVILLDAA